MAEKRYLQSYYTGDLFEYSKDNKDGFQEHTNSKGKVSYRKYYNKGVEGDLLWINRKNNEHLNNREEIEFVLGDGDITYYVNFPVLNNNGDQLDDFAEQIARVLPNLQKGKRYNINNWHMKKGDVINGETVKYNNSGVTFKENGEKIEPALSYQTDNNPKGDIPQVVWKETAGKNRPTAVSKEKRLEYLYEVLVKETERLGYENNGTQESKPQGATKKPSNKVPTASPAEAFETVDDTNVDYDPLPF
jgi:hypothetical protein